jgi:hypothetical protein
MLSKPDRDLEAYVLPSNQTLTAGRQEGFAPRRWTLGRLGRDSCSFFVTTFISASQGAGIRESMVCGGSSLGETSGLNRPEEGGSIPPRRPTPRQNPSTVAASPLTWNASPRENLFALRPE